MAQQPWQKILFYVPFEGVGPDPVDYYIIYDQNEDSIYCADDNFDEQGVGQVGVPTPAITGQYSTYYQCDGTTGIRFKGTDTYPYAEKELVADYSLCSINQYYRIFRIKVPLDITPEINGNDGVIKVYTEYPEGTVNYSLDNTNYQSSHIFNNLSAGTYTVYAKDDYTTRMVEVVIKKVPNWQLLKYLNYIDVEGFTTNIKIKEKDITPADDNMIGTGNPVILNYPGNDDKLSAIYGAELKLNLIAQSNLEYFNLAKKPSRSYLVSYVKNNITRFVGYLLPENYSEPFSPVPYNVELTATDGLKLLENFDFTDDNGNKCVGKHSIISLIEMILNKLELYLPIYAAGNIYEDQMNEAPGPWAQTYINADVFYSDKNGDSLPNCYDVLQKLLQNFTARIYQNRGRWEIININYMSSNVVWYVFDIDKSVTYETDNFHITLVKEDDYSSGNYLLKSDSSLIEIIPGWKSLTTEFEALQTPLIGADFTLDKHFNDLNELLYYNGSADPLRIVFDSRDNKKCIKIDGVGYNDVNSEYIKTKVINVKNSFNKHNFKAKYRGVSNSNNDDAFGSIHIQLKLHGASDYYTMDNSGYWQMNQDDFIICEIDKANTWKTLEFEVFNIPVNGYLTLRISQYIGSTLNSDDVESVDVQYVLLENLFTDLPIPIKQTDTIGDFNDRPAPIQLHLADAPEYGNAHLCFKNALFVDDQYTLSNNWSLAYSLQERINREIRINYNAQTLKLSGTVHGNMFLHYIVGLTNIDERYFMISRLQYSDKYNRSDIELLQIYSDPSGQLYNYFPYDASMNDTFELTVGGEGIDNLLHWGDDVQTNINYTGEQNSQQYSHKYLDANTYYAYFVRNDYSILSINDQPVFGDISFVDPSYEISFIELSQITGDYSHLNPSYILNLINCPNITADVSDFNPSYSISLTENNNFTGSITNFNPSYLIDLTNLPLITGSITNINPSYRLYLYNLPLITGSITNKSASNRIEIWTCPLIDGDITNLDPSQRLELHELPLVTGSISGFSPSQTLRLVELPLVTGVLPVIHVTSSYIAWQMPNITGDISTISADYQINLSTLPLITGDVSNYNDFSILALTDLPLITGDISNCNMTIILTVIDCPNITINSSMQFAATCRILNIYDNSMSQAEVDRIVQRAYDNATTDGEMRIDGNTAPSATALTQINTMVNDRGWTITHD